MASRRTRIKGIANIPQRRKPTTASSTEEAAEIAPKIDQKAEPVEPNLTSTTVIAHDDNQQKVAQSPPDINTNTSEVHQEEVVVEEVPKVAEPPLPKKADTPKKALVIRRKFIKPVVAVNSISRKNRDVNEGQVAKKPEEAPPIPENDKIVILEEVIKHVNDPDYLVPPVTSKNDEKVEEEVLIRPLESVDVNDLDCPVPPTTSKNDEKVVEEVLIKTPEFVAVPKSHTLSSERDAKKPPPSPVTTHADVEYPVPPPSPSKTNRSRIKAVPRFSQRHASFSASESEDESKRNYRHRNDSVCSATSGVQDPLLVDCPSPQKPKEFNSVIQRKCRRTEQSRKLAEARRDFYLKFGNKKPDRQKLTMIDLIFYNPTTNQMSHENKKKDGPEANGEAETVDNNNESEIEDNPDEPPKSGSDEENEMPAPQLKIGPQGEIVVDEQSLVIENKVNKKKWEEMQKQKVVTGNLETGYGVYKRAKRSKDWSKQETLKFYKALNTIGTDFTLMCEFFPRRSRRELKMKFKKEERVNRNLVDRAVMEPCGFDFNEFKHEVDLEEKELEELEKQREREVQVKKEKKRKSPLTGKQEVPAKQPKLASTQETKKSAKSLDIMNVLEESDADVSNAELEKDPEDLILQNMQKPTRSGRMPKILRRHQAPAARRPKQPVNTQPGSLTVSEESDTDVSDDEDLILQNMQKPTRSGRVPRILRRHQAPVGRRPATPEQPVKTKPGSLMVVESTGPTGVPVYNVFMVTGESNNGKVDQNESVSSLSKTVQFQGNEMEVRNVCSFTANVVNDANDKSGVENNLTVPEISEKNVIVIPVDISSNADNSSCSSLEEKNVTICHDHEATALPKVGEIEPGLANDAVA